MAVSFFKEVEINMDSAQFPIKILECPVCYNLPENSIFGSVKDCNKTLQVSLFGAFQLGKSTFMLEK